MKNNMQSTTRMLRAAVLFTALLAMAAGSLDAQDLTKRRTRRKAHRTFAAQTGPDQVTLAWDEVAGATEYRIYFGSPDTQGPPPPSTRPNMTLSGRSRMAYVQGVQRLANGAYLLAMANQQVLYEGRFDPVTRAPAAAIAPPASVQAQETGTTEVTVSWPPVPGATAYMIGRGVGREGLRMACQICPPEAEYVDTTAMPGFEHVYTVQAIFPAGISTRTASNRLLVGEAQIAAAAAAGRTGPVSEKPMSSGTPVAGTAADATNAGAATGTTTPPVTAAPPAEPPAGTTPPTGTPTTGTPPGGTTDTATGTPPAPVTTTPPAPEIMPPAPVTPPPPPLPCKLTYERADNMWAAFGRADGPLGAESITLLPGDGKIFITDWKYELRTNDGSNYFGSHLRIATNPTSRRIRLHLRSNTLTGLVVQAWTGSDTFWILLEPNTTKMFKADLMEVHCIG
jgi:hypothetical protein